MNFKKFILVTVFMFVAVLALAATTDQSSVANLKAKITISPPSLLNNVNFINNTDGADFVTAVNFSSTDLTNFFVTEQKATTNGNTSFVVDQTNVTVDLSNRNLVNTNVYSTFDVSFMDMVNGNIRQLKNGSTKTAAGYFTSTITLNPIFNAAEANSILIAFYPSTKIHVSEKSEMFAGADFVNLNNNLSSTC